MSKQFWVWNDVNCNGTNIEWIKMNGNEFINFRKKPENRKRRFVMIDDPVYKEADSILIECTEQQYRELTRDEYHRRYLHKYEKLYSFLSMDHPIDRNSDYTLHEIIGDETVNVEGAAFLSLDLDILKECLDLLNKLEKQAIIAAFWLMPDSTDAEISNKIGVARTTFTDRKNRALLKLKKFFEK